MKDLLEILEKDDDLRYKFGTYLVDNIINHFKNTYHGMLARQDDEFMMDFVKAVRFADKTREMIWNNKLDFKGLELKLKSFDDNRFIHTYFAKNTESGISKIMEYIKNERNFKY